VRHPAGQRGPELRDHRILPGKLVEHAHNASKPPHPPAANDTERAIAAAIATPNA
jgi:hypothetical protein